jgi:hypothetical protein
VNQVRCSKCGRLYEDDRVDCESCGAPYEQKPVRDQIFYPAHDFFMSTAQVWGGFGVSGECIPLVPYGSYLNYGSGSMSPNPPDPKPAPELLVDMPDERLRSYEAGYDPKPSIWQQVGNELQNPGLWICGVLLIGALYWLVG